MPSKNTRQKVYDELVARGVRHPEVFKGWHSTTLKTGWHYIEFGRSNAVWLGVSEKEALEAIELTLGSRWVARILSILAEDIERIERMLE